MYRCVSVLNLLSDLRQTSSWKLIQDHGHQTFAHLFAGDAGNSRGGAAVASAKEDSEGDMRSRLAARRAERVRPPALIASPPLLLAFAKRGRSRLIDLAPSGPQLSPPCGGSAGFNGVPRS